MSFCIKCGKENTNSAKFCTKCGATLTSQPVSPQAPTPPTTPVTKSKSPLMVVSIVAVFALLVAGYFLFFNKKSKEAPAEAAELQQASVPGSFPQASQKLLSDDDVRNLSQYNLRIMRNEIYARHGFIFQNTEMKNYFSSQSWYTPQYGDVTSLLTTIEQKNIALIRIYEKYVPD